ncbi:ABC transporter permease [Thermococcus chitonophagus]|uniref:ABC transporter permease n=1 Tax=Thermococcus chitonophagus TaxID=54262 RepID=A0A160VTP8_9EURY|nr:ABC transporter permease [Thermococcus chitonophagus]ASJ16844.1 ABC transporter permease [Thermococcus chitonophagus]CUX78320.1 ABC-type transport, permease protein [Thermococcus chitonophagus]
MGVLNIAIKEFEVGIRTRRFYATIAVFFVLALVFIKVTSMAGNFSLNLEDLYNTPFQALFFSSLSSAFNYAVALLAVLLGATSINQEIRDGTIKVLYSKPIYRDTIIWGKLVGGILTIAVTVGLFYIFMIGIALIFGKPVTEYDILRLLVIYPFTILYGAAFYSLGLLLSVLIKTPLNSIVAGILAFLFVAIIIPMILAPLIAFVIAGTPQFSSSEFQTINSSNGSSVEITYNPFEDREFMQWMEKYMNAYRKVMYVSLTYHFDEISGIIFGRKTTEDILGAIGQLASMEERGYKLVEDRSIGEALSLVVGNIVALIISLFVFLIPAYLKFAKIDLR